MFREMRRKRQLMSEEATIEVLQRSTHAVLAVEGDDGYPYAVPISHVYYNGVIYFHSAVTGHKVEAIEKNEKVSLSIVDQDQVVQENFTTVYRSVSIFGKARIVHEEKEKMLALELLVQKFSPDFIKESEKEIHSGWSHLVIVAIDIEHMTGKVSKELVE